MCSFVGRGTCNSITVSLYLRVAVFLCSRGVTSCMLGAPKVAWIIRLHLTKVSGGGGDPAWRAPTSSGDRMEELENYDLSCEP